MSLESHQLHKLNERGTVFYDGECTNCVGMVNRWGNTFRKRGFNFIPFQDELAGIRQTLPREEFELEVKMLTTSGIWLGGVDVLFELWKSVPWLRPLAWIGRQPGFYNFSRYCYRTYAKRRHCKI